jgi:hypothetical protein
MHQNNIIMAHKLKNKWGRPKFWQDGVVHINTSPPWHCLACLAGITGKKTTDSKMGIERNQKD